jgi:succinyl-CoA synthetase alpha subunit
VTHRVVIHRNTYFDSVSLMLASRDAEEAEGVSFAAAVSATPLNLELLAGRGFDLSDSSLSPNDLVVAITAADEESAEAAAGLVEHRLKARPERVSDSAGTVVPRSFRTAARADDSVNVAFVSVPGRYAAYEVAEAIEAGLHVFCFSDGVPLETEAILKRRAVEKGLLFMGADCGTAIIDGVALGFANAVRPGPVGIVGASGTGIQQVTCLLDSAGSGVSHAIGVGGRDLNASVGGVMTMHALELLADDDDTELIVVLSKPPDPSVVRAVAEAAGRTGKPVVLGMLGLALGHELEVPGNVELTTSLEGAAVKASRTRLVTHDVPMPERVTPGRIRGLFCGGSLCSEAESIVAASTREYEFTDFGEDEWTQGRAHPMIDPGIRNDNFVLTADDPTVGVVLLDVVLGYGAHPDPAGELAPLIGDALRKRTDLTVVVSLCGTAGDPQDARSQRDGLRASGALVSHNAAHAARLATAAGGYS